MAWQAEIGQSSTGDKTAGSAWNTSPGSPGVDTTGRSNVVVFVLASDNRTTTDGNTNDHQSCSISSPGAGWGTVGTMQKVREFTNGQGAAAAGATVSVWYCIYGPNNDGGSDLGTLGFSFSGSITAKGLCFKVFSLPSGNGVSIDSHAGDVANDGADAGSIALSSLTNAEHLFVRGQAMEKAAAVGSMSAGANHTLFGSGVSAGTTGGSAATNIAVAGEYRIFTGTSSTSDPTSSAVDQAGTYIALNEVASSPPTSLVYGDRRVQRNSLLRRCSGLLVPVEWKERILVPEPVI